MVVVSAGMEGDTQKDLVLTEARAMVVREYLVENFGFDDSQLKTLGMGKQAGCELLTRIGDRSRFSSTPPGPKFRLTNIRQQPFHPKRPRTALSKPQ